MLLFQSQSLFLDFDALLSVPFAYTSTLFSTPSLSLSFTPSLSLSHSVFHSLIRFNFCHPSHFAFIMFISLLCELISINLLSQFLQLRNVTKPMACKSFKSEIVFKEHFADFDIFLFFFEIHQPKIHSILPTSYLKVQ